MLKLNVNVQAQIVVGTIVLIIKSINNIKVKNHINCF